MVITFLPYKDFEQSLRSLDDRRLGKQRIEALQMYKALLKRVNSMADIWYWEAFEFNK